jgi:hypothetical protein
MRLLDRRITIAHLLDGSGAFLFRPKAAGRQLAFVPIGAPTTFGGLTAPLPPFGFTPDGGHRPSPD